MTSRNNVYAALDSERDYQDMRKQRDQGTAFHSAEEFILYMEDYLHEARNVASRTWGPEALPKILEVLRKVTALGVACMEIHGAPQRKGFERDRDEPTRKIVLDIGHAIEQLSANPELGAQLMALVSPEITKALNSVEAVVESEEKQITALRGVLHNIAYEKNLTAIDMQRMAVLALYGDVPFVPEPPAPATIQTDPFEQYLKRPSGDGDYSSQIEPSTSYSDDEIPF